MTGSTAIGSKASGMSDPSHVRAGDNAPTAESAGWRLGGRRVRLADVLAYAGSSASLVLGSGAQLIAFAVLARSLGPDQFGALLTITIITGIAMNFVGLGASEPMVRRVAVEPALYPRMLGHNLILGAASGILVCPLTAVILVLYAASAGQETLGIGTMLAFAFANTILLHIVLLSEQAFIARGQFGAANGVAMALGATRVVTAGLACLVFGVDDLASWARWHLAGFAVLTLLCIGAMRPLGWPDWGVRRQDLRQGFYFQIGQLGLMLRQGIDILVLGLIAPAALVANFGIARRIADTSHLTVNALHRIMYPRLAVAMKSGLVAGRGLALRVAAAAFAIALATAIGVYVLAPLLPVVFGPGYEGSVAFVRALCFALVPYALWTVGAEVLGASAQHGLRAILIGVGLVGVALIAAATYLFGTTGTIVTIYVVECVLAFGFWRLILGHRFALPAGDEALGETGCGNGS